MHPAVEPTILSVCLTDSDQSPGDRSGLMVRAETGLAGLDMLHLLRFDLVVVSSKLPDMSLWAFVRRMRRTWSWQKWVLVSDHLGPNDEIRARALGALAVLETPAPWSQVMGLARNVHRHQAPAVVNRMAWDAPVVRSWQDIVSLPKV